MAETCVQSWEAFVRGFVRDQLHQPQLLWGVASASVMVSSSWVLCPSHLPWVLPCLRRTLWACCPALLWNHPCLHIHICETEVSVVPPQDCWEDKLSQCSGELRMAPVHTGGHHAS